MTGIYACGVSRLRGRRSRKLVTLVMSNSQYPTPEKLQENQQRKIYPDEPERLLRIQTQDRRCTV
nr:MAG TPA: hypothetical protein [Caudoviricetes sp.]